ncbi:hypothetical protein DRO69_02125 [Candidatus Bathyarchaeota archaeon]|nr:MAG: hypothetical protein DRO69_02125 [Candidatus Bathyarchaeota archaeon]
MSYVWSSGVSVTISPPPPPEVASVTITPERTEGVAPVTLEFKVTAVLDREVYDWEKVDVEIVLAVNSKDNIVSKKTVTISPGYKAKSAYLTYTFSKPGTYTVWGGARRVGSATYTYSPPVEITTHPAPTPELKNLAITGAIAAIIVIAASAIERRK